GKLEGDPILDILTGVFVVTAFAHAEDIEQDQHHEDHGHGDKAERHGDAIAAHALIARPVVLGRLVVTIIPAPKAATMRDFARTSAAQLRLALDLDAIADDRHDY